MQNAAGMRDKCPGMRIKHLGEIVISLFVVEIDKKEEEECTFWNLIFKSGRHHLDDVDRKQGMERYTTT